MSAFWNIWVWVLTLGTLVACLWLLQTLTQRRKDANKDDTTGHSWDGDLKEFNNPLPRWWLSLFWVTAVFMVVYLLLYPGLGSFAGTGAWSQTAQYDAEVAGAEKRYGNIYAAYAGVLAADLGRNPDALRLGRNIFLNRCATCHGSDGGGAKGFPNLTDAAWLYGGAADTIEQSITNGRTGVMPAIGAALGEQGVIELIAYLRSIGPDRGHEERDDDEETDDGEHDTPALAAAGQQKFATYCSACHGMDAKGSQAIGAPDLTDGDWLHGPTDADIRDVIDKGRVNQMPAQKDKLTPDRIHVLAGYVLNLGSGGGG